MELHSNQPVQLESVLFRHFDTLVINLVSYDFTIISSILN